MVKKLEDINLLIDPDAERRFLGACLIDALLIRKYFDIPDQAFGVAEFRQVWETLKKIKTRWKNPRIDTGTIISQAKLEWLGFDVESILIDCSTSVVSTDSVDQDYWILMLYFRMRHARTVLSKIAVNIEDANINKVRGLTKDLDAIINIEDVVEEESIDEILDKIVEWSNDLNFKTNFNNLDSVIGWFKQWQLVVIGARPWMGKTAVMLNLMLNQVLIDQRKVLFISLEMSSQEILKRMFSTITEIQFQQVDKWNFTEEQKTILKETSKKIKELPLRIVDSTMSLWWIMRTIRDQQRMHWLDIVYIDYLQLLGDSSDNRVNEISLITRKLKLLAKELWITIITWSQLNRANEKRPDKRPALSDLRESGSIEQDADIVAMLYRESYYDEFDTNNFLEFNIVKHRNWACKKIVLWFNAKCMKMYDVQQPNSIF